MAIGPGGNYQSYITDPIPYGMYVTEPEFKRKFEK
jgi:hypothetical protein